jgi:hypothetical protein
VRDLRLVDAAISRYRKHTEPTAAVAAFTS